MPAQLERPTIKQAEPHGKEKKPSGPATAVFWSLLLFAVINLLLWAVVSDGRKGKSTAAEASIDYWNSAASIDLTLRSWRELGYRPDVMLVGSSLVMFPFWSMDVEIDQSIGDIFHHRQSITLQRELEKAGLKNRRAYSLAVFGQMASDAYLYVNEFLKDDRKPQVLLFGIAPRDFHDANLPSPMATFSFQKLVGLNNFNEYASSFLPTWEDKGDWLAQHICYFYGKRWRLQLEADKAINKVYKLLGMQPSSGVAGGANADSSAASSAASSAGSNAGFMMIGSAQERFANSLVEYQRRYRNIGDDDLNLQMGFLERTLAVCKERGIKVVLVNMPLTPENRALLPPGFYDGFRDRVARLADQEHVRFIDLGLSGEFKKIDYWDTTHLNHLGGHKLLKHVTPAVVDCLKE